MAVEPVSADPKSDDFLVFRLINTQKKKQLAKYRADDIVQMRNFMVSLGNTGTGVFSPKSIFALDIPDPEPAFFADVPPSQYFETVQQFPTAFYYPNKMGFTVLESPIGADPSPEAKLLPLYSTKFMTATQERRPWNDTFRPPNGPAVLMPISMGYGSEVGLKSGQQAIWDPNIKSYCLLDHNDKKRVNGDPRKPYKKPTSIKKKQFDYGAARLNPNLEKSYKIFRTPEILVSTRNQAKNARKPRAFELYACGKGAYPGQHGQSGRPGVDGQPGMTASRKGACGGSGGNGGTGDPGLDGLGGGHASAASDVVMYLDGDANELKITGTCQIKTKLGGTNNEEVFFVSCHGGDGGIGGNGGTGGCGGDGGAGGRGAPGKKGFDAIGYSRGGNGGPGGDGGNGGNGGTGGRGGMGGDGGDAGAGGVCVICTSKPELMVLVEADCTQGIPGTKGNGGEGGRGGQGGTKGLGGPGGPGGRGTLETSYVDSSNVRHITHHDAPGRPGPSGYNGNDGKPGTQGKSGMNGKDGQQAEHGGISWVIQSNEGKILQQSATRYSVKVKGFRVVCEHADDIFEPNERIAVSEVTLVNNGGLSLPAGAEVLMEPSSTVNFDPTRYKLPEIAPGKSVKIPTTFYGRIFDQPPPTATGGLNTKAEFYTRVELLGRPFLDSLIPKKLVVQYPVKLSSIQCAESVGRGETTALQIEIENISSRPYGLCDGSAGEIGLKIHMDARFIPVAFGNLDETAYTATYDPKKRDSLFVEIKKIEPKKRLKVVVIVQMDCNAELFDLCLWQAELCLRGKVIEYDFRNIRVSPIYIPRTPPADVLMITSSELSHQDFVRWQRVFQILGTSTDLWDTTRYNGLSADSRTRARHSETWVGRYRGRLILFPNCNLSLLYGLDIVDHFQGHSKGEQQVPNLRSGMVLYLPSAPNRDVKVEKHQDQGDVQVLRHLSSVGESLPLPKGGYSGKHITKPSSNETCLKWEKQTLQQLEKENPSQSVAVLHRTIDFQSKGFMKYSYGEVDIRRCPLKRSSKLIVVDGAGGSIISMGSDDPNLSSNHEDIPLASNFGQVLLHTLYCLSLSYKLAVIKGSKPHEATSASVSPTFSLPNGLSLSLVQLSAICAAYEIADEVLDGSKNQEMCNFLLEDVQANKDAYARQADAMSQMIDLIDREIQARKKSFDYSEVSKAVKETKKMIGHAQKEIQGSSKRRKRSSAQFQMLPGLAQLQDGLHVHRSHQHQVKDERWNLLCQV